MSWSLVIRSIISEFSGGHPASGLVVRESLRLMADSPAFYVAQSPVLLPFLFNETTEVPPAYKSNSPFSGDVGKLYAVMRAKTLHFSSMDAWLDFSRTCDLSFGMRIHGTMVPLQAGVPSILISHDSRTSGLAQQMGIPTLSPETFVRSYAEGPSEMLSRIAHTMDDYDARRAELAGVMRDYLVVNGLNPHGSLRGLMRETVPSPA